MRHPVEHFLVAVIGAVSPLVLPIFVGDAFAALPKAQQPVVPPAVAWNAPFFLDMMILAVLGLIGGALSLVGLPIPVKSFKEGCVRVLIAGAVAAVGTGMLITYLPVDGANPAIRCGLGAFVGFLSYPLILWVGQYGFGWLLKKLGLPEKGGEVKEGPRP